MEEELEYVPWPREDGDETPAGPKTDKVQTLLLCLSLLLLCAAIVIAAYPFLADRWGAWRAEQQFTQMQDSISVANEEELEAARAVADEYNAQFGEAGAAAADDKDFPAYEDILNIDGTGIMCWLEVPKLGLKVPVYHDDGDATGMGALMSGAMHIQGTSLPVGGESTNTVITGHSGMRNIRMFDQLEKLDEGDIVILWTLGKPYAYSVSGFETVLPTDTDVMSVRIGEDQLTIITCRPIGINSHRLIMKTDRTDYDPSMLGNGDLSYLLEPRLYWFIGSLAGLGVLLWLLLILLARRRKVWHLNRIHKVTPDGFECAFDEDLIAETIEETDEDKAQLELKQLRRMKLVMFGGEAKGKWRRVKDDRHRLVLEFKGPDGEDEPIVLETEEAYPDYVLPSGEFEAECLDHELMMRVDNGLTWLVFSRKEPKRDEEEEGEAGGD